jgi:hypothetical protein
MPGISFVGGINTDFVSEPAFRTALVAGVLTGETAHTAMPVGNRRPTAATHNAAMSFASANARLGWYFTFGPLCNKASTAAVRSPS